MLINNQLVDCISFRFLNCIDDAMREGKKSIRRHMKGNEVELRHGEIMRLAHPCLSHAGDN